MATDRGKAYIVSQNNTLVLTLTTHDGSAEMMKSVPVSLDTCMYVCNKTYYASICLTGYPI